MSHCNILKSNGFCKISPLDNRGLQILLRLTCPSYHFLISKSGSIRIHLQHGLYLPRCTFNLCNRKNNGIVVIVFIRLKDLFCSIFYFVRGFNIHSDNTCVKREYKYKLKSTYFKNKHNYIWALITIFSLCVDRPHTAVHVYIFLLLLSWSSVSRVIFLNADENENRFQSYIIMYRPLYDILW